MPDPRERAYLRGACIYLSARWQCMGNEIQDCPWYAPGDVQTAVEGMRDWAAEMRLILAEWRAELPSASEAIG